MDSRGVFHNPFLAFGNGDELTKRFHLAAGDKSNPFILVLEGSVPNEGNKEGGGLLGIFWNGPNDWSANHDM